MSLNRFINTYLGQSSFENTMNINTNGLVHEIQEFLTKLDIQTEDEKHPKIGISLLTLFVKLQTYGWIIECDTIHQTFSDKIRDLKEKYIYVGFASDAIQAEYLLNSANAFVAQKRYVKAERLFYKSIALSQQGGDSFEVLRAQLSLLNLYTQYKPNCLKAQKLCQSLTQSVQQLKPSSTGMEAQTLFYATEYFKKMADYFIACRQPENFKAYVSRSLSFYGYAKILVQSNTEIYLALGINRLAQLESCVDYCKSLLSSNVPKIKITKP